MVLASFVQSKGQKLRSGSQDPGKQRFGADFHDPKRLQKELRSVRRCSSTVSLEVLGKWGWPRMGSAVFNQILTRFHGIRSKSGSSLVKVRLKSGRSPLKIMCFRGTRCTPTGSKFRLKSG